jgi:hypothetical protein
MGLADQMYKAPARIPELITLGGPVTMTAHSADGATHVTVTDGAWSFSFTADSLQTLRMATMLKACGDRTIENPHTA